VLHALAAATQDVAVDGLAVAVVAPGERGRLQGWTQTGMLAGRGAFGGGALLLERYIGADAALLCLVAVTWSSLGLLALSLRTPEPERPESAERSGVLAQLAQVLGTRRSLYGLVFALLSGAGFEVVGALAGTLLVDRGVDQASVGWFFAVPSVLAMVAGALLGGRLSDRAPRARAVGRSLWLVCGAVLSVAVCDSLAAGRHPLMFAIALTYFGIGLFVASSYAWFMDLTDARLGATHFSAYMGATNACEAWSGWAGGRLQGPLGYAGTFALLAGVSLLAVLPLRALDESRDKT
jgi:predicted MFS family arabinose efflux permease